MQVQSDLGASRWPILLLSGLLVFWGCEPREDGVLDVPIETQQSLEQNGQNGPPFDVADAMTEAIQDEYRAQYTYAQVLLTLGEDTGPFDNIVLAEAQHVAALSGLFINYEWDVPESEWDLTNVPTYTTRVEACIAGVAGEIANIAMYDVFLAMELPVDVETVFLALRNASQDRHLPAFEGCSVVGPVEAMEVAIQDEYEAFFTYTKVISDLGDIAPFNTIVLAEAQHVASLAGLFTKRELPVPESLWDESNVETFKSRPLACIGGVEGETLNVAMYAELLFLELPDDVRGVFENLQAASLENHLPAFSNCPPPGPEGTSF